MEHVALLLASALPILVDRGFLGGREVGAAARAGSRSLREACLDDGLWLSLCRIRWPSTAHVPQEAVEVIGGYRAWYRRCVTSSKDREMDGFGPGGPQWRSVKRNPPRPQMRREDVLALVDVSLNGLSILSRALRVDEIGVLLEEGSVEIQLDESAELGTCETVEFSDESLLFYPSESYSDNFNALVQIINRKTGETCCVLNGSTMYDSKDDNSVPVTNENNAIASVAKLEVAPDELRSLPLKSSANFLLDRIVGSRLQIGQLGGDFCKILRVDTHFQLPEFCFNLEIIPRGTPAAVQSNGTVQPCDRFDERQKLILVEIVRVKIRFNMFLPLWYEADSGEASPWTDALFGPKETIKHKVTILHLLDHLDWSKH